MRGSPRCTQASCAAALLAGALAAPVSAVPILQSQLRTASAHAELVEGGVPLTDAQQAQAADFTPFTAHPIATSASGGHVGAADGYQESRIEGGGGAISVEAGGAALGYFDTEALPVSDSAAGEGSSVFEVVFSLNAPAPWSLAGVLGSELEYLRIFATGNAASVTSRALVSLTGAASGEVFRREVTDLLADFQPVQEDVAGSGVLGPDTWTLHVSAHALAEGGGGAEGSGIAVYALRFQVVPEPGTGLLIGAGLSGLVGVARCASRKRLRSPEQPTRQAR